ncbi:MAG: hypothetical protein LBD57_04260 [Endomicrobium sp.]|jgi:hypothetical protein|uniref:hypothetical protein n=1 Tax=Candidatus Endomicrobiellum cubanum TaxID=3242325 RepID=UPI00282BC5E6|nr:hypothetical protein [Endomicrobium sp.]
MLYITIQKSDYFNEELQEFFTAGPWALQLEHSLLSISKWESKWHKAFLSKEEKTIEETLDYIRCMCINANTIPETAFKFLTVVNHKEIAAYIEDSMTATTINDRGGPPSRQIITSEVIYYWMVSLQIPFECQKWHLNRLLTLIRVCNANNTPQKKMSRNALYSRNSSLNAARRKALGTTG